MTQLEISCLLSLQNKNLTLSAGLKGCKKDIRRTKACCLKEKRVESGEKREMFAFVKS